VGWVKPISIKGEDKVYVDPAELNDLKEWKRKATDELLPALEDAQGATKEQLIELYRLAFPNQPVNTDWVAKFVGKDMSDVLQALRDDPSRQSYITSLVNDAAASQAKVPKVLINGVVYAPAKE
jgi:hypothetical protein